MVPAKIAPVHERERHRALDTLVVAFTTDPVERWLYPEAHEYLTHFPAFLSAFAFESVPASASLMRPTCTKRVALEP